MRAARILWLALAAAACVACGVKAPPVAPQHPAKKPALNLDCSPQDPDCDRTDPNYRPH